MLAAAVSDWTASQPSPETQGLLRDLAEEKHDSMNHLSRTGGLALA
jgi:hypothetical protein